MPAPVALVRAVVLLAFVSLFSASPGRSEEWSRQDGPFGGTVIALDADGTGAVYAQRNDTVFRTTDGGAHWDDVGPTTSAFTFLALDITPGGAIWTGTSSRGVAWSLNGGQTWTNDQITNDPHSGLGATIVAIGVDPAGRILAGGFRSVNQGGTFTPMSIGGLAFAFDAAGEALAGTADGVWRSSDGGASWVPANAGMETERVGALAIDAAADLWAGTANGNVWRSTDGGATWTPGGPGLPGGPIRALEALPGGVLAAPQGGGVYRTTDGGLSWVPAGADPGQVQDLLAAGGDLWLGTTGRGVFVSGDGGASAVSASAAEMFAPGLSALAADAGGTLYLSSTSAGAFRSTNGGASWAEASTGLETLFVQDLAAAATGRAWATTWSGIYATTDGGDSWTPSAFADRRAYEIEALPADRLVAVVEDGVLLPTLQLSTDAGATWQEVWSSATAFSLSEIAVTGDGTVLVGGSSLFGGLLLRSTDAGATWSESQLGFFGIVALAADTEGRAWAALADNVVHRSTDHGVTWEALPNGGWPTGTSGSIAALEHAPAGLFLVGTGDVYRSTDHGDGWSLFDAGLPGNADVTFVAFGSSGPFAGTHYSGLFRLTGATGTDLVAAPAAPAIRAAPNPFRAATRLRWDLPRPAEVRVVVHDVLGRRVAELSPGFRPAGPGAVSWDGTSSAGRPVPPGTYFVRWEADGRTTPVKVLRMR